MKRILSAKDALHKLDDVLEDIKPGRAERAIGNLDAYMDWERVLKIYAQLWPEKFQRDKRKGFCFALKQFFGELNNYFTLYTPDYICERDRVDWETVVEETSRDIPIEAMSRYDQTDCSYEEWEDLAAWCLHELSERKTGVGWIALEKKLGRPLDVLHDIPDRVDWDAFDRKMRRIAGGPEFVRARRLVECNTGIWLLDVSQEEICYGPIEWSLANVRMLIREGKEANEYSKPAERAIRKYNKHPKVLAIMLERAAVVMQRCPGKEQSYVVGK
jgi:hypothetical protein